MSFNFKFSKVKAPSKLLPVRVSLAEPEEKTESKPDFVTSIDNNEVQTVNPVKEKSPLVIPLIQNNVWRKKRKSEEISAGNSSNPNNVPATSSSAEKPTLPSSKEDNRLESCESNDRANESLDEKARRELINEAQSLADSDSASDHKRVIPLLLQNKVPDGFEEDDNFDVSIRPDKPSAEDYERVPVSEFGMAMLRGMGFDEKKAVSTAPVEVKIRYKGLGLGADAPPPPPPSSSSSLSDHAKKRKSDTNK